MLRPWVTTTLAAVVAVAGAVGVYVVLTELLHLPRTPPGHPKQALEQRKLLVEAFKAALGLAAGVGAVVALALSYRHHRIEESQSHRDDQRLSTDRFRVAAEQLGHDEPAVRLAGVHAMATLADDWDQQRQTCIDVLCAYLRLPSSRSSSSTDKISTESEYRDTAAADREVRQTIVRLIAEHLRIDPTDPTGVSWQRSNFDFTGSVFDGSFSFDGATFSGQVNFHRATFAGEVNFYRSTFAGQVSFYEARFAGGQVSFGGATFAGGQVSFGGATFAGGQVSFGGATFAGGQVSFGGATFSGPRVSFGGATFSGAEVSFDGATVSNGRVTFGGAIFSGSRVTFKGVILSNGRINFGGSTFSAGHVSFDGAGLFGGRIGFSRTTFDGAHVSFGEAKLSDGWISFDGAIFADGWVSFDGAEFSGARISLDASEFCGGRMDFRMVLSWEPPPFTAPKLRPPGLLLPLDPASS
jgi:uncharacterized protein YjbI with pentapeptide repeats